MAATPPTHFASRKRRRQTYVCLPAANHPEDYERNTRHFLAAAHVTKLRLEAPFPCNSVLRAAVEDSREEMHAVSEVATSLNHLGDVLYTLQAHQEAGRYWGGTDTTPDSAPSVHLFENPHRHAFYQRLFFIIDDVSQRVGSLLTSMTVEADRAATLCAIAQAREGLRSRWQPLTPVEPEQEPQESQGNPAPPASP
jgi:hypothetical protein